MLEKKDIESRADIIILVDRFYAKAKVDDLIGVFFNGVVTINWEQHMPRMYDFWESTLLGNPVYNGNPMSKHVALSGLKSLEPQHFDRWIALWAQTVNEGFVGRTASGAIEKARFIRTLMEQKVSGSSLLAKSS